jgi:hypothetical protein
MAALAEIKRSISASSPLGSAVHRLSFISYTFFFVGFVRSLASLLYKQRHG